MNVFNRIFENVLEFVESNRVLFLERDILDYSSYTDINLYECKRIVILPLDDVYGSLSCRCTSLSQSVSPSQRVYFPSIFFFYSSRRKPLPLFILVILSLLPSSNTSTRSYITMEWTILCLLIPWALVPSLQPLFMMILKSKSQIIFLLIPFNMKWKQYFENSSFDWLRKRNTSTFLISDTFISPSAWCTFTMSSRSIHYCLISHLTFWINPTSTISHLPLWMDRCMPWTSLLRIDMSIRLWMLSLSNILTIHCCSS